MSDLLPGAEPPEPVKRMRADALRRADDAWRVRTVGGTWEEAARIAGYSCAENAIRAVRETFGETPEPARGELRHLWRERLEHLWRQAVKDAAEQQPGAITAAVRVAETALRLDGLAAPTEHVVYSPTTAEIENWVSGVLAVDPSAASLPEEADILAIEEADPLDGE